ncbi:MAG: DUF423 domain-containing protein [Acidobacteriota bacterium]
MSASLNRQAFIGGALSCALAIAAGAFGAHALEGQVSARSLELWRTAALYLAFAGFGQLAAGLAPAVSDGSAVGSFRLAGHLLLWGGLIFAGTVFALALGAPSWLGAVTPLGGSALLAGFVFLAVGGWRASR